jgi:hypothetical protein
MGAISGHIEPYSFHNKKCRNNLESVYIATPLLYGDFGDFTWNLYTSQPLCCMVILEILLGICIHPNSTNTMYSDNIWGRLAATSNHIHSITKNVEITWNLYTLQPLCRNSILEILLGICIHCNPFAVMRFWRFCLESVYIVLEIIV